MRRFSLVLAVALAGCSSVDSQSILTSGMHASLSATSFGEGTTHVRATLYLGHPINLNFVDLTGDDQLVAWQDETSQVMSKQRLLGTVSYNVDLAGDADGTPFRVELRRTVDDGAPDSHCTLPAPFSVESDQSGTTLSAADDVDVTWAPSGQGDGMEWKAEGNCIERASGGIEGDPGAVTISAGTFQKPPEPEGEGNEIPDACDVTVTVERRRLGTLDPAYGEGGAIHCAQARAFGFRIDFSTDE